MLAIRKVGHMLDSVSAITLESFGLGNQRDKILSEQDKC